MHIRTLKDADNAVSDIVGFLLLLTIMIISLGIITLYAQPVLDKSKDDIYFSNMKQSFTLLHSDIQDIASSRSTIKSRDLNIASAHIAFDPDSTKINITTNGCGGPFVFSTGSIEYNLKDLKVCLENGALLSSYNVGSMLISKPAIYTDPQTTIINIVKLDGPGFSVGGEGIVRIILQKNYTESFVCPNPRLITINSQYADGWAHYLENQGFTVTSTPGTVTADISGSELRVYSTNIEVSSNRVLPIDPPENSLSAVITTPSQTINQSNILLNVTIYNTGNRNFSQVMARTDYFSDYTWDIFPSAQISIGNIPAGSNRTGQWNISTNVLNNEALFTVTVDGSGESSLFSSPKYQTRSNQIMITRLP